MPDRPASALWNAAVKCLQNNNCIKNHDDDEKTIVEKLTVDRCKIRRAKEKFARKQKAKKLKKPMMESSVLVQMENVIKEL